MGRVVPVKVAQLAALPAIFVAVTLGKTPRHPRAIEAAVEADAATGVVPPERFFAGGAAPGIAIDLGAAAAIGSGAGSGWFQVTLTAELADESVAARVASEIDELLLAAAKHYEESDEARARLRDEKSAAPLTPPEVAAFSRRGVRSEIGAGWPGSAKGALPVARLGRVLVVAGLKGDFAGLRPNPLAALLEAEGARVHVEGDPAGAVAPVLDLIVEAPDEATAASLGRALDDYLRAPAAFSLRPPWHPAGVTPAEASARATFNAIERALTRAMTDPHLFEELRDRLRYQLHDPAAAARVASDLHREHALRAIESCAKRPGADPVVVDELRRAQGVPGVWADDAGLRRRLAERMGALAVEVGPPRAPGAPASVEPTATERALGATGRVQVEGKTVSLGRVTFQRLACGLPLLLRHLASARCSRARLAVTHEARSGRFAPGPGELVDPEGD